MRHAPRVLLLAVVSVLACATLAAQGPSSKEDKDRLVSIVKKLEAAPLDKNLRGDMNWAFKFLVDAPDIHSNVCTAIIPGLFDNKWKYEKEIVMQLTLAGGAFDVEHPNQDVAAQYVAQVESSLKAYSAILAEKPSAHSKALDDMLEKQKAGTLADAVKAAAETGCQKK